MKKKRAKTPKKKQFPPTLYVEREVTNDGEGVVYFTANPDLLDVAPAPGARDIKVGVYQLVRVLDVWSDPDTEETKNPDEKE